jgi:hypothetical protein
MVDRPEAIRGESVRQERHFTVNTDIDHLDEDRIRLTEAMTHSNRLKDACRRLAEVLKCEDEMRVWDGSGSSWATLDEREQVEFGLRFQLMAFEVPVEKRRACGAFKLNFTSTLKPSEANSLQLACCNLYSTSNVSASVEEAVSAVASPSCGIHQVPGATSTLMKLLGNIAEHPGYHKFKKVRASRIQAHLLDHPQVVQLLSSVGFRPLIMEEEDAFILFSEGTRPLEALKQAHSILKATLPVT